MISECRKCGVELAVGSNWYASLAARNNRSCKVCHKAAVRKSQNTESFRNYQREWQRANRKPYDPSSRTPEVKARERIKSRAYTARHPDRRAASNKAYREKYPDRAKAIQAASNAMRKGAPLGVGHDPEAVKAVYDLARSLTERFGVPYQVDHLIPISKSGEHHQDNLVVMRADWNLAKSAQIIPPLIRFFGART